MSRFVRFVVAVGASVALAFGISAVVPDRMIVPDPAQVVGVLPYGMCADGRTIIVVYEADEDVYLYASDDLEHPLARYSPSSPANKRFAFDDNRDGIVDFRAGENDPAVSRSPCEVLGSGPHYD